ncbi:TonB-dependent receptor [Janthinobacterium sp.]|uniref:TonB-dependent receptor plug domain-containing protein n=1 Tax=Janthinobacterium sp. TaxID=1871054 RepID=UPI00293D2612|nr:TonB-dependent receptor [Janthinobacterium sp.]
MPSRLLSFRLTLAAAAVLAAWSVHAEQAPVAPEPAQQTPVAPEVAERAPVRLEEPAPPAMQKIEVKGSTTAYDPRRDDTASKMVVGSEEILRYGDTSVLDVFKRLPGITVNGASGRGGGEVRMRGLGGGYTQILLNGERAPAGFSIDSLAPDAIERIEVLRAASAEFSTQSIAGTINIVLKKAIQNAQRELKLSRADAGTYQTSYGNLQLSCRDGGFSYSLAASMYRNDYHYDTPVAERGSDAQGAPSLLRDIRSQGHGRNEGLNLAPRLNWTLAGGDTLTWQNYINAGRWSGTAHDVATTTLGTPSTYRQEDQERSGQNAFLRSDLSWMHKLEAGAKLELKLGGNGFRSSGDTRDIGVNAPGGAARDSSVAAVSVEKGFSSTGKYSTPFGEGQAVTLGWDGGVSLRDDERAQRERDVPGSHPVNSDEGFSAKVRRLALYGQDEWNMTPQWSVYAGMRWEGVDTRSDSNVYDTVSQRSSVWSPLFHSLWKLNSKDQVRLALTRTYKAPATSSLIPRRFTSANNSQTEPDRRGNPHLKPELALGLDASYEHYWGEGGLLSASASMRRIDGYTRQGLLFEDGRWLSTPVNAGQALTRGVELEAKLPLRSLVAGAPQLDLRASLSRNWSRVDSVPGPDNRLGQQTPLSAVLGADYKAAGGSLSAGGSFVFKNGGAVRVSERQRAYVSVRRELDVYALWKFDAKNQLRMALSNLLAQDEYSESSYSDASGVLTRNSTTAGRVQARLTMEMKF